MGELMAVEHMARAQAMNEVDREIEERKARMRALREEEARKNGGPPDGSGAGVPAEVLAREMPPTPRASPEEQKLLEAAARIYKPGEVAYPARLSNEAGKSPACVSMMISNLRKKGLWPYGRVGLQPYPDESPEARRKRDEEREVREEAKKKRAELRERQAEAKLRRLGGEKRAEAIPPPPPAEEPSVSPREVSAAVARIVAYSKPAETSPEAPAAAPPAPEPPPPVTSHRAAKLAAAIDRLLERAPERPSVSPEEVSAVVRLLGGADPGPEPWPETDAELFAIERALGLLRGLPAAAARRAARYVHERIDEEAS